MRNNVGATVTVLTFLAIASFRSSVCTADALFRWVDVQRSSSPLLSRVAGTWEDQWFVVGSVLRTTDGQYRMYYEASSPVGNTDSALGLAYSSDGVNWQRASGNPIWTKAEGGWTHFIRDARVYQYGPSNYRLYYSDGDRHIDLATSTDGLHWTNYSSNPVLSPSQSWEDYVMQESVLKLGDGDWRMWYSTYGSTPRVTGYATSPDGARWTKHEGNPTFGLGENGTWDDRSAFQPAVFQQDGYFHMLYTGSSKTNPTGYRMGYAWSKDGVTWTKSPENPIFVPGVPGTWDGGKICCPTVVSMGDGVYNIYYSGGATSSGTYTGIGMIQARLILIPEPSTLTLAAIGILGLLVYVWRKRSDLRPLSFGAVVQLLLRPPVFLTPWKTYGVNTSQASAVN